MGATAAGGVGVGSPALDLDLTGGSDIDADAVDSETALGEDGDRTQLKGEGVDALHAGNAEDAAADHDAHVAAA